MEYMLSHRKTIMEAPRSLCGANFEPPQSQSGAIKELLDSRRQNSAETPRSQYGVITVPAQSCQGHAMNSLCSHRKAAVK